MTSVCARLLPSLLRRPALTSHLRPLSISHLQNAKKFSEKHEWVDLESGGIAKVGITHYAQESLGELVYVQPPDEGQEVAAGEECGTVESVKAASDLYSPVSGTVTAHNPDVLEEPKLVNTSPEEKGWLFQLKMSDESELDELMDKVLSSNITALSHHGNVEVRNLRLRMTHSWRAVRNDWTTGTRPTLSH